MESINELIDEISTDIIDSLSKKDELCSEIWRDENTLIPDVKDSLINASNYFMSTLEMDEMNMPDLPVLDAVFTGSLANYNWSDYSDIDIHIIVDLSGVDPKYRELLKAYFECKKKMFAERHDIRVKGYEVEFYMEPSDEPGVSTGTYSLQNDSWIKKPVPGDNTLNKTAVRDKTESVMKEVDRISRDVALDSVKPEASLNDLKFLWKKIKTMRKSGLERNGEFSVENLVFKLLRRNGYVQKIIDMRSKLIDRMYSTQ